MLKAIHKIFKILYSLFMENKEKKDTESKAVIPEPSELNPSSIENRVDDFLKEKSFKRTFPLNLVELAEKIDEYKIFYLKEADEYKDKEAIIYTKQKIIAINGKFKKDEKMALFGRYIICKMIAHIALGHIDEGAYWIEPIESKRDEEDRELNPETAAFAYELLMPEKDFREQWDKLGQNIEKLSNYFGALPRHIIERKCYLFKDGNNG